jgi:hypothetical protein
MRYGARENFGEAAACPIMMGVTGVVELDHRRLSYRRND